MTLAERVRQAREAAGLTTRELSRRIGFSPTYISQLENGRTKALAPDIAERLAAELGVAAAWLLGLDQPRGDTITPERLTQATRDFLGGLGITTPDPNEQRPMRPMLRARASAGTINGDTISEGEIEDRLPGSPDYADRNTALVRVSGDCMQPILAEGDLVEFEVGREPQPGEIVVAVHAGVVVVKEFQPGLLLSRNPDYPPIEMNSDTRIRGVALEMRRPL